MRRFVPSACFFLLRLLFFQAPLWGCATRHRCDEKTDKKKEEGFAFFGQRDGPSFLFSLFSFLLSSFSFVPRLSALALWEGGALSLRASEREKGGEGQTREEYDSRVNPGRPKDVVVSYIYVSFFGAHFFSWRVTLYSCMFDSLFFLKKSCVVAREKVLGKRGKKKEKKQKGSAKKERKKGNVFVQTVEGRKKKGENANLFLFFYLLVS